MSLNYQINNILHNVRYQSKAIKSIIGYVPANTLYDKTLSNLDQYAFVDASVVTDKSMTYGLTVISNIMDIANNAKKYKNFYSNKLVFIHDKLISSLKKEDQYILLNSAKDYKILSFVPGINNIQHIKYGLNLNANKNHTDRSLDVLILYKNDKRQAQALFNNLQKHVTNIDIVSIDNIHGHDTVINLLNNTKICIDTTSYFNVLMSVSCGCIGITMQESYDKGFIFTIDNLNLIPALTKDLLSTYNDNYISDTQKYIQSEYNYTTYLTNLTNMFDQHINMEVTL
jgi:hypothetical protein